MANSSGPGSKRLTIALVYNLRTIYLNRGYTPDECAGLPTEDCLEGIASALEKRGYNIVHLPEGIKSLVQSLAQGQQKEWDLVFNHFVGARGVARAALIPALLEAHDIPFTFSDAATIALCYDKVKTNTILNSFGIPTAPFALIPHDEHDEDYSKYTAPMKSQYPLFAKLNAQGSSLGIFSYSKIGNQSQLNSTIERLKTMFPNDDIILEKFLSGREFTVGIIGTGKDARVMGVLEIEWNKCLPSTGEETQVVDFGTQVLKESYNPDGPECVKALDMNDPKVILASEVALGAHRVLGCRDGNRIDVRFGSGDDENVAYVMDVNPIFDLEAVHAPTATIAERNGISFEDMLDGFVQNALKRIGPSKRALPN